MTSRTARVRAKERGYENYAERMEAAAMALNGISDLTIMSPAIMPALLARVAAGDLALKLALSMLGQVIRNFSTTSRNLCGCCDYQFPDFAVPQTLVMWAPRHPGVTGAALNFALCPACSHPSVVVDRATVAVRRIQPDARNISVANLHEEAGRA